MCTHTYANTNTNTNTNANTITNTITTKFKKEHTKINFTTPDPTNLSN
jgi:hypothetical protein